MVFGPFKVLKNDLKIPSAAKISKIFSLRRAIFLPDL